MCTHTDTQPFLSLRQIQVVTVSFDPESSPIAKVVCLDHDTSPRLRRDRGVGPRILDVFAPDTEGDGAQSLQ